MPQLASNHQMIRSAIVSHITSHWEDTVVPYGQWIGHVYRNETTKTYTHRMEGPKKDYGDYPELVAAAELFQHHVVVLEYVTDSTCFHEIIVDIPGVDFEKGPKIIMIRVGGNHYHAGYESYLSLYVVMMVMLTFFLLSI